jgi:hypothetical protein
MMFEAGAGDGTTDNATIGLSTTPDGDVATTTLTRRRSAARNIYDIYLTLNSPLLPPGTVTTSLRSAALPTILEMSKKILTLTWTLTRTTTTTEDNETGGDGSIPGEDDDDHDVASITIEGFDLALLKVLACTTASA